MKFMIVCNILLLIRECLNYICYNENQVIYHTSAEPASDCRNNDFKCCLNGPKIDFTAKNIKEELTEEKLLSAYRENYVSFAKEDNLYRKEIANDYFFKKYVRENEEIQTPTANTHYYLITKYKSIFDNLIEIFNDKKIKLYTTHLPVKFNKYSTLESMLPGWGYPILTDIQGRLQSVKEVIISETQQLVPLNYPCYQLKDCNKITKGAIMNFSVGHHMSWLEKHSYIVIATDYNKQRIIIKIDAVPMQQFKWKPREKYIGSLPAGATHIKFMKSSFEYVSSEVLKVHESLSYDFWHTNCASFSIKLFNVLTASDIKFSIFGNALNKITRDDLGKRFTKTYTVFDVCSSYPCNSPSFCDGFYCNADEINGIKSSIKDIAQPDVEKNAISQIKDTKNAHKNNRITFMEDDQEYSYNLTFEEEERMNNSKIRDNFEKFIFFAPIVEARLATVKEVADGCEKLSYCVDKEELLNECVESQFNEKHLSKNLSSSILKFSQHTIINKRDLTFDKNKFLVSEISTKDGIILVTSNKVLFKQFGFKCDLERNYALLKSIMDAEGIRVITHLEKIKGCVRNSLKQFPEDTITDIFYYFSEFEKRISIIFKSKKHIYESNVRNGKISHLELPAMPSRSFVKNGVTEKNVHQYFQNLKVNIINNDIFQKIFFDLTDDNVDFDVSCGSGRFNNGKDASKNVQKNKKNIDIKISKKATDIIKPGKNTECKKSYFKHPNNKNKQCNELSKFEVSHNKSGVESTIDVSCIDENKICCCKRQ